MRIPEVVCRQEAVVDPDQTSDPQCACLTLFNSPVGVNRHVAHGAVTRLLVVPAQVDGQRGSLEEDNGSQVILHLMKLCSRHTDH